MKTIFISPNREKKIKNILCFDKETNTFYGSEREIPFDSRYKVLNVSTNDSRIFEFVYSTGPEFDPKTQWIYKSEDGVQLIISNDPEITKRNAKNYLNAKTRS